MIDIHSFKKHKILLSDYDFKQDIQSRMIFSTMNKEEIEVLEEILFSPLKFPISEIAKILEIRIDHLKTILEKITTLQLIQIEKDFVIVNKDLRKFFDNEIQKFSENFIPGMDYIQSFLKKVPIQVLPTWYQIPRTSDNIFDSLVEKIFLTPQIYQRHLYEVKPQEEVAAKIFDRLFNSPSLKLYLADIKEEFNLSKEALHEIILDLEFNFIACLAYEQKDDRFIEILTPFREWKEFLMFSETNKPISIKKTDSIELFREHEYAFIEDLQKLLDYSKAYSLLKTLDEKETLNVKKVLDDFTEATKEEAKTYLNQLIEKSISLGLSTEVNLEVKPTALFEDWKKQDYERKAHFIYKHPNNVFLNPNCPKELIQEKNIREIEKSLSKFCQFDWVYFDDFLKGLVAAIGDNGKVELKKVGKNWKYSIPDYTEKEKLFIQITILEWLFESGVVQCGIHKYRPCFKLTGLGKKMFR